MIFYVKETIYFDFKFILEQCLVAVTSCDGWDIRTIEGLGNKKDGYHKVQTTLAENHGSQCGYCSCGWVMAMQG